MGAGLNASCIKSESLFSRSFKTGHSGHKTLFRSSPPFSPLTLSSSTSRATVMSMIDRQDELRITLLGDGGVGKTALALRVSVSMHSTDMTSS